MHHIDEHTLELHVLGSDLVAGRREEIEQHLAECPGCRGIADQIEAFYRRAEKGLEESSRRTGNLSTALVRSGTSVGPSVRQHRSLSAYQPATLMGRFAAFARRHPVAAGAGGFAALAALALLGVTAGEYLGRDTNPSYVHLNPQQNRVEVYNREHEMLWSLPSRGLFGADERALNDLSKGTVIYDLDGDGTNEILTILPLGEEEPASQRQLTVLSHTKKILRRVAFREQMEFRGAKYDDQLNVDHILCGQYGPTDKPEILVTAGNARSPTVVFRLDHTMNFLGSYIHYGYIRISTVDWRDGTKKLLVFGQNDLGETDSLSSPVMAVLDPQKLVGRTESSGSPGFGLPASPADMYYIGFPLSDMNYAWRTHGHVTAVIAASVRGRTIYRAMVAGAYHDTLGQSSGHPHFEYVLEENLGVAEVKYSSATLRLRQRFVEQGKLRGTFDQAHLANLRSGVRYWDGKTWRREPERVHNPGTPPLP